MSPQPYCSRSFESIQLAKCIINMWIMALKISHSTKYSIQAVLLIGLSSQNEPLSAAAAVLQEAVDTVNPTAASPGIRWIRSLD